MRRVVSSSSINSLNSSGCSGQSGGQNPLSTQGFGSVYHKVWTALTVLEMDPHPQVATMAGKIINYIKTRVKVSYNFCGNLLNQIVFYITLSGMYTL